jgi:hypothetical protein
MVPPEWKVSFLFALLVGGTAFAQDNPFSHLVGRWDKLGEGKEIIIDPGGAVFTNSGDFISGSVSRCIEGGANFCFEGTHNGILWRCAYRIVFIEGGRSVDWGLRTQSHPLCPSGVFVRSGTPSVGTLTSTAGVQRINQMLVAEQMGRFVFGQRLDTGPGIGFRETLTEEFMRGKFISYAFSWALIPQAAVKAYVLEDSGTLKGVQIHLDGNDVYVSVDPSCVDPSVAAVNQPAPPPCAKKIDTSPGRLQFFFEKMARELGFTAIQYFDERQDFDQKRAVFDPKYGISTFHVKSQALRSTKIKSGPIALQYHKAFNQDDCISNCSWREGMNSGVVGHRIPYWHEDIWVISE